MPKADFDPDRRLFLTSNKQVLGHRLDAGMELIIVAEPAKRREVDEGTARMLWNKGLASYLEDHRPTPHETPQQEARRVVQLVRGEGTWWQIVTPWAEVENVNGEDGARARYEEVVAAGRPAKDPNEPLLLEQPLDPIPNNTGTGEAPLEHGAAAGGLTGPEGGDAAEAGADAT